jgi:hypothetical protein
VRGLTAVVVCAEQGSVKIEYNKAFQNLFSPFGSSLARAVELCLLSHMAEAISSAGSQWENAKSGEALRFFQAS